ncbi:MAG: carbohydrate-binding domain-containing protein [Oscillospiraceae bacterium]|nr:carbohydrate-binding domain-containing protein [Oscillospiraceae bacterium]
MDMNFRTLAALCAAAFTITGCSTENGTDIQGANSSSNAVSETSSVDNVTTKLNSAEIKDEQITCKVEFSDDKISVDGKNAAASENTLTISGAGVFSLSGACSDAKILVEAADNDEVTLLLNGVNLTSKNGAVIDCEKAKSLYIVSAGGTENTLSDTEYYTFAEGEDEPDAAVFSRCDTVYNAADGGSLTINGNYKDGLKCKDGFSIAGGTLEINSADDGITGKDFVTVLSGKITINSSGDGIKSTHDTDETRGYVTIDGGEITINSAKDGIQAETVLTVNGGKIDIISGGDEADKEISGNRGFLDFDNRGGNKTRPDGNGSMMFPNDDTMTTATTSAQTDADSTESSDSMKGLKAGKSIVIAGGEINVKAADDSVHANGDVTVKSGTLALSSCDDGIHADETLLISGGKITVTKSYEALEGKNIEISGGEINVKATDDGINAAGGDNGSALGFNANTEDYYISISGGNITVNAGGDGLDSNGTIALSGGFVVVYGPTDSGNGAIDYEKSFAVSGGEMIALGSSGMTQAPGTLSQPCLSIYADVSEDSKIEVRDSSGSVVMSTTTPKKCSSLIFTSDKFKEGESYSIYANDTLLSTVTAEIGITGGGASANGGFGGHGGMGGQRPDGFTKPERNPTSGA